MKNVYIIEPKEQPVACVIWMHGLGADAKDMMGLAKQLPLSKPVRHVCLDAPIRPVTLNNHIPMRAWYDIVGLKLTDREDREGLLQSEARILDVIHSQCVEGFKASEIYLAGFSQGGAMALFTGLRSTLSLGGIIALSSYLPLSSECHPNLDKQTPIFLARGSLDPLVLPEWTKQTEQFLNKHGFQHVASHEYPMAHTICAEEASDLMGWLSLQLATTTHCAGEM